MCGSSSLHESRIVHFLGCIVDRPSCEELRIADSTRTISHRSGGINFGCFADYVQCGFVFSVHLRFLSLTDTTINLLETEVCDGCHVCVAHHRPDGRGMVRLLRIAALPCTTRQIPC